MKGYAAQSETASHSCPINPKPLSLNYRHEEETDLSRTYLLFGVDGFFRADAQCAMEVHVYGPCVATVVGTSTEKGKDKNGKQFTRSFGWIDTWMERNGKWECIGEAVTQVPEKK